MACSGPALDCVWVKSMLGAALDGGGAGGGALVEEKLQPWEASFLLSFLSPYPP
jgi:hypothetical protein